MKHRAKLGMVISGLLLAAIAIAIAAPEVDKSRLWHEFVAPGPLTSQHAFMAGDCGGCHVPIKGVDSARCIGCHANETELLARRPTAFHANIGNCTECHREHQGADALLAAMNHDRLAKIGVRMLARALEDSEQRLLHDHLVAHASTHAGTALVKQLDCYGCHRNQDRHAGLFGEDCAACHGDGQWSIQEFRHPSPSSPDCAQCHRAPPSHYMGHFEMVSRRVAGVEHANVGQCYFCHQTTSWNDIKGVGLYDHH